MAGKKASAVKKRTRTPDFPEWPEWSSAKFFSFIRSGARSKWQRWPPKYKAMADASRPYKGPDKRQKKEFECNECKQWFKQKDVSVDHIVSVGPLRSFEDLPDFYRRLFVGTDKLQVLCNDCHNRKTQSERQQGDSDDDDAR